MRGASRLAGAGGDSMPAPAPPARRAPEIPPPCCPVRLRGRAGEAAGAAAEGDDEGGREDDDIEAGAASSPPGRRRRRRRRRAGDGPGDGGGIERAVGRYSRALDFRA